MNPPEDELETRLRRAMHTEADATRVSPDALVRIRGRVAPPKRSRTAGAWLRPAAAASGIAFTLVAGTLAGMKISGGEGGDTLAEQPPSVLFNPAATSAAEPGDAEQPAPKATRPPDYLPGFNPARTATPAPGMGGSPAIDAAMSELERTHKIPEDTGGPYVAITAPDSGLTVGRTFELSGLARTHEANVVIEVSQNGRVVKRDFTTASIGAPEKGTWTKVLALAPGAYRIDAFEESMEGNGKRLASDTIWLTVADDPQGATKGDSENAEPPPADDEPAEDVPAGAPAGEPVASPAPSPDPMTGPEPDAAEQPVAAGPAAGPGAGRAPVG
jgi:hypothetical protein